MSCFLAFAVALQFLRAGPEDSIKALFAEDGPVYLKGGLEHGFFDSITTGYAEYLVVIPRLIGEVATLPPLRYAPEAMNMSAVFLVALSALAVWIGSAGLVRNTYLRALLVALVLVPPAAGLETVVSATNVPWYTSYAVFWLLLWRPETTWGAVLGALLILLSGLSSPAFFFFLPLAVLRAIAIRDIRDGLLVAAFGIALAVQLPVTLLSTEPVWPLDFSTTLGGRYAMIPALLVASAAIVLADSPGRKPRAHPWPAFAVTAVLLLAIVTSFGGDANREMPSWSGSVRGGAVLCHDRNISEVTLFVSPEGWSMPISCQHLESEYAAPAP